jgi:Flp pilus assembly protein TadD
LTSQGSAHRAQGEWEAAVTSLERAAEIDPKDAAVKAELAKADKQLKKFRYGW